MDWFRFYHEALNDPKVQRLPGDLFKTWVNLLCLASQNTQRGFLPDKVEDIAWVLRMNVGDVEQSILALLHAGLLDWVPERTCYQIHGWDGRQFASDNSTERVRKHRAKRAENSETLLERSSNAPEQSRNRTEKNRAEARAGARALSSPKKNGGTNGRSSKLTLVDVYGELAKQARDLGEEPNIRGLPPERA